MSLLNAISSIWIDGYKRWKYQRNSMYLIALWIFIIFVELMIENLCLKYVSIPSKESKQFYAHIKNDSEWELEHFVTERWVSNIYSLETKPKIGKTLKNISELEYEKHYYPVNWTHQFEIHPNISKQKHPVISKEKYDYNYLKQRGVEKLDEIQNLFLEEIKHGSEITKEKIQKLSAELEDILTMQQMLYLYLNTTNRILDFRREAEGVRDMFKDQKIKAQRWMEKRFGTVSLISFDYHHFIITLLLCLVWILNSELFPYSLTDMLIHVVSTYTFTRAFRTMCFVSTIIPNQSITCQNRKFGDLTHPSTPAEFLAMFFPWQTDGGCNDQIFSGHISIYVVALVAVITYCPYCYLHIPIPLFNFKRQKFFVYWFQIPINVRYLFMFVMAIIVLQVTIEEVFGIWHWTVDIVLSLPISVMMWITVQKFFAFVPAQVKREKEKQKKNKKKPHKSP